MLKRNLLVLVALCSTPALSVTSKQITVSDEGPYPKNLGKLADTLEWRLREKIDAECPSSTNITVENPQITLNSGKVLDNRPAVGTVRRVEGTLSHVWLWEPRGVLTATIHCN